MLIFLFVSRSVFLSLHVFPKKFLINQNRGKGSWPPVATALNLPNDKSFFFHRDKDLYSLFYPRLSLILCCCFFAFKLFYGVFVKCFWQFGHAKFHRWCDYKLAIIKLRANRSTYCLLIGWLIFSC